MTEVTKFECDACGQLWGHVTDMLQIEVRASHENLRERKRLFSSPDTTTLHVCIDCVPNEALDVLGGIARYSYRGSGYIGIKDYNGTLDHVWYEEDHGVDVIEPDDLPDEAVDFIEEITYGRI